MKGFERWNAKWLSLDFLLIIFVLLILVLVNSLLPFWKFLYNSNATSIAWDAPWAKVGSKAKKASPIRKIFFCFGWYISSLVNIGKHLMFFRLFNLAPLTMILSLIEIIHIRQVRKREKIGKEVFYKGIELNIPILLIVIN